ncbi:LexA family transcriptional regulator [Spirosoma endbachense]|uniref:HTH cro/C1-type domain-containing protein n=1 Tax=Spirosoma endbachense TaxID=2666025 RepID=A0A6P1W5F7_9BACT|nr:LexA family transcriptional regulator [Spirosoma endbachense]QHV99267.1 hypothetical protein GJR95_31515 [Spirosoma endbachense]
METPASRIQSLMDEDKLNQTELAEKINKSRGLVSSYLNPDNKPSDIFLRTIEDELGWSARWIRTGIGPKRLWNKPANQSSAYTQEPISPYNAQPRDNGGRLNMWVVPARAQAGFINGFAKRLFAEQIQRVSFPMIQGECFCFEVEGFSMFPDYVPGSYVVSTLLEDWTWMRKGKIYVFQTDEGIIVKAYENTVDETVYLSSSNPTYNPVAPISLRELRQVYNIEFKVEKPRV